MRHHDRQPSESDAGKGSQVLLEKFFGVRVTKTASSQHERVIKIKGATMKEKYLKEKGVLEVLGISSTNFKKNITAGCPGRVDKKGFPLYAICRWIASRPKRRTDRTQARQNALKVLDGLNPAGLPLPVPETKPTQRKKTGELGLEAALSRIKKMEEHLHSRLIEAIDGGGYETSTRLKDWQDSLEILRKVESDFLKVAQEQKRLMSVDAVKSWLDKKIESAKAFLLNVPGKIAPALDGLPWHEIQKRLDVEVRNALSKLATNDLT